MPARDTLSPDDEQLLPLIVAIADGTPVDWARAPHPLLPQLQHLERLVRGHEAVRSQPARGDAEPARETLLTEARRKGGQTEQPLRVEWGPLVVHEKIGRGSFGDVYRAWDPRLDREVALKLIPEDISAAAASPVVSEGRLLARVRHPNVMVVHGAERVEGRVGIWTEYIRGETLAGEIARRGPLPAEEAARIGADVCAALAAVHGAGLLHRDVKAQNILRDAAGRIVLGDFGTGMELVRLRAAESNGATARSRRSLPPEIEGGKRRRTDDARVSDPQIAGTPLYLAPETLAGTPATIASDLYAVGVLLYFLVTGGYPVRGRTLAEIKRAHATRGRTPVRDARPDLPQTLIDVIDGLLDAEPAHRHETAAAVEAALRRWLEHQTAAQAPHRVRYAMALGAGAILLTAVMVGGVWRDRSWPTTPGTRRDAAPFVLKAGDWIIVSEFENQTGESVLNGTIRAAVERELEYSDFVRVVQRDRIEDALKLLQRPLDSPLNRDLALQLSHRDGEIRALVTGTIAKAGSGYRLTFDVVDAASQAPHATLSDQAPAAADVLAAVRRQTLRIRETLGEPAASIERSREAFQGAALPSLRALHLMTQAKAIVNLRQMSPLSDWIKIEKIAREIIQENPAFPMGHNLLAWSMRDRRREPERLGHAERAFLLAGGATPQERYFIIASVHSLKGGLAGDRQFTNRQEVEKAAAAMEALFALQPDHYAVRNNLRILYRFLGRERDIAWMNQRLADARPWGVDVNLAVANQLLREGNVEGARRYGARARSALSAGSSAAHPDLAAAVRLFGAHVAWMQDDASAALRVLTEVARSAGDLPDAERSALYLRLGPMYAAVGRLQDAERAIEAARPADRGDAVNTMLVDMARADLFDDRRDPSGLREFAASAWHAPLPSDGRALLARRVPFLIKAGMLDAAERDLEWFTDRTADGSEWAPRVPTRQLQPFHASSAAAIELARGRPAEAVVRLRQLMPAIRDAPPPVFTLGGSQGQFASMALAAALEAIGNISEAITTLEQAVGDRVGMTIANTPNRWLRTNAYLARLYRRSGQEVKARAVEAHLLKLLAAADADHPLLVELSRRR